MIEQELIPGTNVETTLGRFRREWRELQERKYRNAELNSGYSVSEANRCEFRENTMVRDVCLYLTMIDPRLKTEHDRRLLSEVFQMANIVIGNTGLPASRLTGAKTEPSPSARS